MEEDTIRMVAIIILVVVGFVIFLLLLDQMLGGHIVRTITCGILFWIPGVASALAMTQGCAAIPA